MAGPIGAGAHARPLPDAYRPPAWPEDLGRILVRLPNWLGDIVMAAPTVAALAEAYPGAGVTVQAPAPFLPLARALPGVRDALPAGKDRGPREVRGSARRLAALGFDAALILPRSFRATLAPWRARIPVRVGWGGGALKRRLTHPATGWRDLRGGHRSRWFAALLAGRAEVRWPRAPLEAPASATRTAAALLAEGRGARTGPLVALECGASYGAAKCWPATHFASLARRLRAELDAHVVTIGVAASKPLEDAVVSQAGDAVTRLAGRTPDITELMAVLAAADVVVSNDTGPMHVATAMGTPVVAMFGASDPQISAPLGPGHARILYDPPPCGPCFLRTCVVPGHPCLSAIAPSRVFEEVVETLSRAEAPGDGSTP